MVYYRRRFYDPNLQRWLNRDPVGEYDSITLYTFVDNNPLNYVDEDGLTIVGKVIVFVAKGTQKGFKVERDLHSIDEAIKAAKEGEDVVMKCKKYGREVARGVGNGATPILEYDKASGTWHYHDATRSGGHILFGVAGMLTLSYYAEGQNAYVKGAAEALDLFNPLTLPSDAIDIANMVNDWTCGPPPPTPRPHSYFGPNGQLYIGVNPPAGWARQY